MKVLLTGVTGFVGSYVAPALLAAGHEVVAIVRPASANRLPEALTSNPNFKTELGDAAKAETLVGVGEGCDAVIHLVGIIEEDPSQGITFHRLHVEATRNITELARRIKAKRYLQMSALGSRDFAESEYHRTKYAAEAYVKKLPMPWTIFRPSLIFGPRDGFVNLQKQFIQSFGPVIVPGSGESKFQPVYVENIAEGFVKALTDEKANNKIYDIGGPDTLTFNGIIDMIAEAKHATPIVKVHLPMLFLRPFAGLMQSIFAGFPVNKDQLVMLAEDSVAERSKYFTDFNITPRAFDLDVLRQYV